MVSGFISAKRIIALASCPVCLVDKDVRCVDETGQDRDVQHKARVMAARNAVAMTSKPKKPSDKPVDIVPNYKIY